MTFASGLKNALDKRRDAHLLREIKPVPAGEYVNLAGNDYLNLSENPKIVQSVIDATRELGTGSTGSRLVTGTSDAHLALEKSLADLKGMQSALVFSSGWQANASIPQALDKLSREIYKKPALFLVDKLAHASMIFGTYGVDAEVKRFRHNDVAHLEKLLQTAYPDANTNNPTRLIVILTESVFSMDGDVAPLDALCELARNYHALTYIDEAHATGVLGTNGRGLAHSKADMIIGTGGKALGSQGAFFCASRDLVQWVANNASGFIYSTAPMPANIAALRASVDLLSSLDAQRAHLSALGQYLRDRLRTAGFDILESKTHIVPVIIGAEDLTLELASYLKERGFIVGAIRPPTVPKNTARLRLSLHSEISFEDLDRLIALLEKFKAERL